MADQSHIGQVVIVYELLHIIGHGVIAVQLTVGGVSMVSQVLEVLSGTIEKKLALPTHDSVDRSTQVTRQCSDFVSDVHQKGETARLTY